MSSPAAPLWHESERPREKLLRHGAATLSEAELLAILLQTGTRGHSAIDTARVLLGQFRSLRGLLTAERQAVCRTPGLGAAKYALLQASIELARRHYAELMEAGPPLANPRATRDYLRARLRDRDHEVFCCLFLDNRIG
jgi:DNA repair protein RadC